MASLYHKSRPRGRLACWLGRVGLRYYYIRVSYERSAALYVLFGAKDAGAFLAAGDEHAVYVFK